MFEKDYSLLDRMRINSDAVVVNQTNSESKSVFEYNGNNIVWINSLERGLSKSRNLGLKYCSSDIVLLADNDEVLCDNYSDTVNKEFSLQKKADLIIFNLQPIDSWNKWVFNKKRKRLHKFNIMKYGSPRIAFKRQKLASFGINFNENFGAGTENGGGEDSLFLNDVLKNHLICCSSPNFIGKIFDNKSTWFVGYNYEYFCKIGIFLNEMFPHFRRLIKLLYLLKHFKKTKDIGFKTALKAINSRQ